MSALPTSQISSQFSSQIAASTAVHCDRFYKCNVTIQPGQPRLYVANQDLTLPGKYLCEGCYNHYKKSPLTLRRPIAPGPSGTQPSNSANSSTSSVDIVSIRRHVNEAQRQGAHTPQGRVTAMPPPSAHPPAPMVHNPLYYAQYFNPSTAPNTPSGYNASHGHCHGEAAHWSSASYSTSIPAPLALPARVSGARSSSHGHASAAAHISGGRIQSEHEVNTIVHVTYETGNPAARPAYTGIKEGITIGYEILPYDFFKVVWKKFEIPIASLFPGFSWNESTMVLREDTLWKDVLGANLSLPYFDKRFMALKSGAKSAGALVFKHPPKPVAFLFIIDRDQWVRAEEFADERASIPQRSSTPEPNRSKRKTPPSPEKPRTSTDSTSGAKRTQYLSSATSESALSDTTPPFNILPLPTIDAGKDLSKSMSQINFTQLDADEIRMGIHAVGSRSSIAEKQKAYDSKQSESVSCFTVKVLPFQELCQTTNKASLVLDQTSHSGTLSYDLSAMPLGRGTFKDAILATLTWIDPPEYGLGASSQRPHFVAAKRPFEEKRGGGIKRLGFADESAKLHTEATLLGWVESLLRYSYAFIDDFLSEHTLTPPFPIPRLRFVQSALAYSKKPVDATTHSITTHRAVYLLEELLTVTTDTPFIKYIHNGNVTPLPQEDEVGYDIAVFLCFIQHIQYKITFKQVYISDFQAGNLLTDPQVMTDHSEETLFGEGNVHTSFAAFPTEHQ